MGLARCLFYLFVYLFSNLGAFAIVIALEKKQGEGVLLDDYKGLVQTQSGLGVGDVGVFAVVGWYSADGWLCGEVLHLPHGD